MQTQTLSYKQDLLDLIKPFKQAFMRSADQEETTVQYARRIMGKTIASLSDEEVRVFISEFQYLLETFMDEYERSVFDKKTLKEVLWEL
jgi:ABC-type transporter MlaC component